MPKATAHAPQDQWGVIVMCDSREHAEHVAEECWKWWRRAMCYIHWFPDGSIMFQPWREPPYTPHPRAREDNNP